MTCEHCSINDSRCVECMHDDVKRLQARIQQLQKKFDLLVEGAILIAKERDKYHSELETLRQAKDFK